MYGKAGILVIDDEESMRDSCLFKDYALVAGGHNFRPDRDSRIKNRYFHKQRGFVSQLEIFLGIFIKYTRSKGAKHLTMFHFCIHHILGFKIAGIGKYAPVPKSARTDFTAFNKADYFKALEERQNAEGQATATRQPVEPPRNLLRQIRLGRRLFGGRSPTVH